MPDLTPNELKRLERLMKECRTQLRTLPKDDALRCQVGRVLRAASVRADKLRNKARREEEAT